jgi:ubiquinone/menaquinone biosynthesis C-methylase UbiE
MLERVLEPEVMDDPREARLYDAMDHRKVNLHFLQDFLSDFPSVKSTACQILDCGTGTAHIPILFCQELPTLSILACDAAASMLDIAQRNVAAAGLQARIRCQQENATQLGFDAARFDAVISNSLIHHLAHPDFAISEMARVVKPGGFLFVRDLLRPQSVDQIEHLVQLHAGAEPTDSQQLLRQSLAAALDLSEIREMVSRCGFSPDTVQVTSDRHWTWSAVR